MTVSPQHGPGDLPVPGLVRQARRLAGLSQRELARYVRVSQAEIARIERGSRTPGLDLLQRLLGAAGLSLVAVDADGRIVCPLETFPYATDAAGRHYPAHYDLIIDPEPDEWWGSRYGLARPPETFHRDPSDVERRRRESRRQTRPSRYGGRRY